MNIKNIFHLPMVYKLHTTVMALTLLLTAGCSSLDLTPEESCNSRAYLRSPIDLFIKERFPYGAPVRLGIIPFAVPANFAGSGSHWPGAGNELARYLHREFLSSGAITITEIIGRHDWPGQNEEFYHGNFRSISMAKDAGYDLVLVGVLENSRSLDALSASAKLIEVESGITVWNGRSEAITNRIKREKSAPTSWWLKRDPSELHTNIILEKLAQCLTESALSEDPVP